DCRARRGSPCCVRPGSSGPAGVPTCSGTRPADGSPGGARLLGSNGAGSCGGVTTGATGRAWQFDTGGSSGRGRETGGSGKGCTTRSAWGSRQPGRTALSPTIQVRNHPNRLIHDLETRLYAGVSSGSSEGRVIAAFQKKVKPDARRDE